MQPSFINSKANCAKCQVQYATVVESVPNCATWEWDNEKREPYPNWVVEGSGSPVLVHIVAEKAEKTDEKQRTKEQYRAARVYIRLKQGVEVAWQRGLRARWFTLTESDYAQGMGFEYAKAVKLLRMKLSYDYGGEIQVSWVEHLQGDCLRHNRHMIELGVDRLRVAELDTYWHKIYGSRITGMEEIRSPQGLANYLSRYVSGEDFVRARFGRNWVFEGWFEFSKYEKERTGEYPDRLRLAMLAEMTVYERIQADELYRGYYLPVYERAELKKRERAERAVFGKSDSRQWRNDGQRCLTRS